MGLWNWLRKQFYMVVIALAIYSANVILTYGGLFHAILLAVPLIGVFLQGIGSLADIGFSFFVAWLICKLL
jgi:hypothetical protein